MSVKDHAHALLAWVQGEGFDDRPGGRSGEAITTDELRKYYLGGLCAWHDWKPYGFNAISREFGRLVGGCHRGKYLIPRAQAIFQFERAAE